MAIYGYHRTSTEEQNLDRGVKSIKDYCNNNNMEITEIFTDKQTGKNFDRPDYKVLKRIARKNDTIIISELDRLGRNKQDTLKELKYYNELEVRVMILEIPTTLISYDSFDDSMAKIIMETINNMLIEMYATFAHAEMQKREKRQREGIEAKKARGEWNDYGRPRAVGFEVFEEEYKKVLAKELKANDCMKNLNISPTTYYRYRDEYKYKQLNQHML